MPDTWARRRSGFIRLAHQTRERFWLLQLYLRALPSGRRWFATRARLLPADVRRLWGYTLAQRLMDHDQQQAFQRSPEISRAGEDTGTGGRLTSPTTGAEAPTGANQGEGAGEQHPPRRTQRFLLVRHGQSTFNVEGRLPSQLPGVALTDVGRRQAQQAAIGLASLRLSAVVTSPLERARDTAAVIARGQGLPLREDPRLMDTEMGRFAGRKISEISDDTAWKAFLAKPTEPPEGFEGFNQVRDRVVAAIEDLRADPTVGDEVVVVAHADVIKLILAHYTGVPLDGARFIVIGNASVSVLAFTEEHSPTLLATNWTIAPDWLVAPVTPATQQPATPGTGAPARDAQPAPAATGEPTGQQAEQRRGAIDAGTGEPAGVIM